MNRSSTLSLPKRPSAAQHGPTAAIRALMANILRHYEAGRMSEAEKLCLQVLAIDVRHADALYVLGMVAFKGERYEVAAKMIRRAIASNGRQPYYHSNLGNALMGLGKHEEAIACFKQAIEIKADHAEAHYNLGNCYLVLKKLDEAVASYKKALEFQPDYADALCNLGTIHRKQNRLAEAVDCFERALALKPESADFHCNLGDALHFQGKIDEAMACYNRTLELDPNHSKACNCLCNAYFDKGNIAKSTEYCERAIKLKPEYGDALMNHCLLQLLKGDYENGWQNYEVRWKVYTPRKFSQPRWQGEPLNGARILLHAEQGLGDSLQFLRYAPMVQAAGGKVILDLPEKLRRLVTQMPGLTALINTGDPIPIFKVHSPLLSLPLAFGTTVETIPAQVPYLTVPEEALQKAAALKWPVAGLRVGVAWTGNLDHPKNKARSVTLEQLEPLFNLDDVHFFSLQVGPAAEDLTSKHLKIVDLAPETGDMADTGAQMANLDLVISIDTSVAHLAGALGRPLWVLLAYLPDWRWLMEREDCPWYPTARLFRQQKQGEWAPVIERLKSELLKLAAQKRADQKKADQLSM